MSEVVMTANAQEHRIDEKFRKVSDEYETRLKHFNLLGLNQFDDDLELNKLPKQTRKIIYDVASEACMRLWLFHSDEKEYIDKIDEIKKTAVLQATLWIADNDLAKYIAHNYLEEIILKQTS